MLQPITPTRRTHPHLLKFRQKLLRNQTLAELHINALLLSMRVKYTKQQVFFCTKTECSYIADFWLPHQRVVLECDGRWHFTKLGRSRDLLRDEEFALSHIRTVRLINGRALKLKREGLARLLRF